MLIFTQDALQVTRVGQDKALSCLCQQQHTSKRNDPRQGRIHAASRSRDEGDGGFFSHRESRGSAQVWNLGRNRQSEQSHRSSQCICPPSNEITQPRAELGKEWCLKKTGRPQHHHKRCGLSSLHLGIPLIWD